MIFAKINPVATVPVQNGPFVVNSITGSYLTAIANQYPLGTNKVNFRIVYGECIFEEGSVVGFNQIYGDFVELSGSEVDNWGTDDSYILDIIAEKQGTTIVEIVSGSLSNGGFF